MTNWKLYVLWFAQEHVNFRYAVSKSSMFNFFYKSLNLFLQEIKSILESFQIPYKLPLEFNELVSINKQTIIIKIFPIT